ncbi:hypothetical protein PENTCL1PPCAC_564, partial [Pristionchus entomophagus]
FRKMLVSFIFLLFLQCVTADFVDHLSAEDRTDFEKLDAETDLTENQLLDNIGDWAKEKGLQKQWTTERRSREFERRGLIA